MHSAILDSFYGQDFIDWVEEEAQRVSINDALVMTEATDAKHQEKVESTRRSKIAFLQSAQLKDELFNVVSYLNANQFGFDIWNVADVQYTIYESSEKGHYDWHQDDQICVGVARTTVRKLSLTVQLSDPSEYEGGDFEMQSLVLPPYVKNKGTVLLFPSPEFHRVTPVTKGVRKSLVAWFQGPSWR